MGHVSPQFHVVYNNEFRTVPCLSLNETLLNWLHLVEHCSEQVNDDKFSKAISWIDHDNTHDRHLPEQILIPLL